MGNHLLFSVFFHRKSSFTFVTEPNYTETCIKGYGCTMPETLQTVQKPDKRPDKMPSMPDMPTPKQK